MNGNGTVTPRPPAALAVRFLRDFHHYGTRDVALFPRLEAIELVRQGIAEYADLDAVRRDPIVK